MLNKLWSLSKTLVVMPVGIMLSYGVFSFFTWALASREIPRFLEVPHHVELPDSITFQSTTEFIKDLREAAKKHKTVIVELKSYGGLVMGVEAIESEISNLKKKGTKFVGIVNLFCASACTLVSTVMDERYIVEGSRYVFHLGMTPENREMIYKFIKAKEEAVHNMSFKQAPIQVKLAVRKQILSEPYLNVPLELNRRLIKSFDRIPGHKLDLEALLWELLAKDAVSKTSTETIKLGLAKPYSEFKVPSDRK